MSFKSLAVAGKLKKTDLFRVQLADLKVEKGFNLRDTNDPEVNEHIQAMLTSLLAGVILPPMEVRVTEDDDVFIVDGHCRHQAYLRAKKAGHAVEWLDVLPFRGNDTDRIVKMIASSQGRALTPLERAMGYKRLRALNIDEAAIAASVGKSTQHVHQMLALADANADVHTAIRDGKIAATTAVHVVEKHGEKAGAEIQKLVKKANGSGKAKVTAATISPSVPKSVGKAALQLLEALELAYEHLKQYRTGEEPEMLAIVAALEAARP